MLKKLEKFFRQSIETEAEVIENALGGVETGRGKIAGGEAAHDNTAGERVREFTVDPFVGLAVLEAVDRVDEDTYPRRRRRAPRGRRRWWNVRGERICWRSAGGLLEVCWRSAGGLPEVC